MPPRPLTITPTPFKSSFLSIPPSPFSPLLPITPPPTPPKAPVLRHKLIDRSITIATPPPPRPLPWLWQCHQCNRVYRLSVTRRCLDDGHLFCAGSTAVKGRSKKRKVLRHRACASEFDYAGWKVRGTWRRMVAEEVVAAEGRIWAQEGRMEGAGRSEPSVAEVRRKDCWQRCDYPSECRWGKQFGVKTPVLPSSVEGDVAMMDAESSLVEGCTDDVKPPRDVNMTFDDIMMDMAGLEPAENLGPRTVSSSISSLSDDQGNEAAAKGETRVPSVQQLVMSAKRRKHKSQSGLPLVPSPLAAHPPSMEDMEKTAPVLLQSTSTQPRAVDDITLYDHRKGFDLAALQQRADAFWHSWRLGRAKIQAGIS